MDLSTYRKPTPSQRPPGAPTPAAASRDDELRLLAYVESISRHLRAVGRPAEALAVENLGTLIELYAEHHRPRLS